jgi:uncharacterized protein (TIGR03086 family)
MQPKELYLYAIDEATRVVQHVTPVDLQLPTPDTEWNVHDLLQHIVYELAWTSDIVQGRTVTEVGDRYERDLLDGDPVQAWRRYASITRNAVKNCDIHAIAHLSYTDKSVGAYLYEAGNDQLIHAWDLGQAVSVPVVFDENAARMLYEQVRPRGNELVESGLFAAPVVVPETASIQTKLLAIQGRSDQGWH